MDGMDGVDGVDGGGWLDYVKLRLAKASQLSWSWGLAWLSLAIYVYHSLRYRVIKCAFWGVGEG